MNDKTIQPTYSIQDVCTVDERKDVVIDVFLHLFMEVDEVLKQSDKVGIYDRCKILLADSMTTDELIECKKRSKEHVEKYLSYKIMEELQTCLNVNTNWI